MGGMVFGAPQKKIVRYAGSIAPEKDPTAIQQHHLNLNSRVWTKGKEDVSLGLNAARTEWNQTSPQKLDRLELGLGHSTRLDERRSLGIRASIGSASDRAFHSQNEISYTLIGHYIKPEKEPNVWIFTVFMSNNNPILNYVPIPGFIYLKKTEKFVGMFGLPFLGFQWFPVRKLTISMSSLITNYSLEAGYAVRDRLLFTSGFMASQQTYLKARREDLRDRLFFNEKKYYIGLKVPIGEEWSGDFQLGQSFDRKIKSGHGFSDAETISDLGRSWYAGLNVMRMF